MRILKVTQKQSFAFSSDRKIFLGPINFWQGSNPSFYLSKNELRKNCCENHQAKDMMPYMFFSICSLTLRTLKFWHTDVIMYSDSIVIVEPLPVRFFGEHIRC